MRVESVNVGQPELLEWQGRHFRTAIRKRPVEGPARVEALGFVEDAQADLRVHGGADKAVYLYPAEHRGFWAEVLGAEAEAGAFGENLTTRGLPEAILAIGDEVEIGGVLLQVSQPRLPCVKLAARHRRADLPKRFVAAERPGVYFRVLREGSIGAGDPIRVVRRVEERWTVPEVFRVLTRGESAPGVAVRLAGLPTLGRGGRSGLQESTGFRGEIRIASPTEAAELAALLDEAGLPREGFPHDTPVVLAARDESGLLGGVALEEHGPAALLRSLVVRPAARGRELGRALTRAVLARAWGRGATSVSLLTETAPGFFAGMGFSETSRADLPPELVSSKELQGVCPESARVFVSRRPSEVEPASIPG
jgi:MOSC domain-containing protein YiiM/N-acetylglutamate synthase-like GNAT family acetyltransferase